MEVSYISLQVYSRTQSRCGNQPVKGSRKFAS